MAVREFDGTDDIIFVDNGTIGQLGNGSFTLLAVLKPTSKQDGECIMEVCSGSADCAGMWDGGSTKFNLQDDTYYDGPNNSADTTWQISVITCTGTGNGPRYHRWPLAGSGWSRVTAGTTWDGNTTTATQVCFGGYRNSTSFKDMRLAVAAVWNSALSDGNIDTISTAKTTQSINALSPLALWDFNQAAVGTSVTDLTGNGADQTSRVGTTVIVGDDPPGWTFGLASTGKASPIQAAGRQRFQAHLAM
jgi:hypothetical protein